MQSQLVSITIVTATLNAERFLPTLIRSIQQQHGDDFSVEHVVADGGSSDRTVAIATAAGCHVLEGRDRGVFDALNKGLKGASGDLFVCLGADDALPAGALSAVARWFPHRKADWVVGAHRWINGAGQSIGVMRQPPRWIPRAVFASLGWCSISFEATYMTHEFFTRLGGYDASFKIMGDYKLFAEALDIQPFDCIHEEVAIGCLHGDNVSAATTSPAFIAERQRIADAYGPKSRLVREVYRLGLRVWMNGRSPGWFVGKRIFGGKA